MNESRLKTILTVLPVFSAGLYLMGAAYHQGYLSIFGLDDSQFPLATDKSLLSGFFALATVGLMPILYAVLAALALAFTVLIAAVLSSHPRVKHWQAIFSAKLVSWRSKNTPSETMNNLMDKSATIHTYAAGIFLVIFSLVVASILSGKSGKEHAFKEIISFRDEKGSYAIIYSKLLTTPTRAKQVICSQSHCAFWIGDETLVLRHESVERISMHNSAPQEIQHNNTANHSQHLNSK